MGIPLLSVDWIGARVTHQAQQGLVTNVIKDFDDLGYTAEDGSLWLWANTTPRVMTQKKDWETPKNEWVGPKAHTRQVKQIWRSPKRVKRTAQSTATELENAIATHDRIMEEFRLSYEILLNEPVTKVKLNSGCPSPTGDHVVVATGNCHYCGAKDEQLAS